MRTEEIQAILSRLLAREEIDFLGVFPRDRLPEPRRYPACFVANTDPASKPGSHWVVYYFPNQSSSEFFDSYGQHPSAYGFNWFTTTYNTKLLQSLDSSVCGHYCIFYIYFRTQNLSSTFIASQFHPHDFAWNDKLVTRWIKKLGHIHIPHYSSHSQCCCAKNK